MSNVKILCVSPRHNIEATICNRVARIGSPKEGTNADYKQWLRRAIDEKHWSPFEFATFVFEVITPFYVAAQMKRHSFVVQEYSARYYPLNRVYGFPDARTQPSRRNPERGGIPCEPDINEWWQRNANEVAANSFAVYEEALRLGIASEVARAVLPLQTETRMILSMSLRTLMVSYIPLRTAFSTQAEHRDIATRMAVAMRGFVPEIASILGWDKIVAPEGAHEYSQEDVLEWDQNPM